MKGLTRLIGIALVGSGLLFTAGVAHAVDISGPFSSTLTIFDNSQLVGNVTCTVTGAPCIQFGMPGITLSLNGFTMTGQANAITGCRGTTVLGEAGISTNGQDDVVIEGPGLVQRFQFSGVFVIDSSRAKVRGVTVSTNCLTGIFLLRALDTDIEENVLVRNGNKRFACGGIELILSNNNRIRGNEVSGNGYAGVPAGPALPDNDFGIGLNSASNDNLIEENSVVGNTNGIRINAGNNNNVVRRNLVVGNPPIQISNRFPFGLGVDILNLSPLGANNTFEENLCVTSSGAFVTDPCSSLPDFAGHENP